MPDLSIYVDPDGKRERREWVETLTGQQTRALADETARYVQERIPATDKCVAEWGGRQANTGLFDRARMAEAANGPGDGDAKGGRMMNVLTVWSTDRIRRMSPDQLEWLLGQVVAAAREYPDDVIHVGFGPQQIEVTRSLVCSAVVALQSYAYGDDGARNVCVWPECDCERNLESSPCRQGWPKGGA